VSFSFGGRDGGDFMAHDDEEHVTVGQGIKYGLLCFAIGAGLFLLLSLMESSGHGGRVHWLIAALYYIGGKWTVAGVFALGGLGFFVAAYRSYSQDEE
jgi:hypothetical protein